MKPKASSEEIFAKANALTGLLPDLIETAELSVARAAAFRAWLQNGNYIIEEPASIAAPEVYHPSVEDPSLYLEPVASRPSQG